MVSSSAWRTLARFFLGAVSLAAVQIAAVTIGAGQVGTAVVIACSGGWLLGYVFGETA